jgi:hypothetical protein
MYTAIRGIYENGKIELLEPAPSTDKAEILISFLNETKTSTTNRQPGGLLKLDHLKGKKLSIPSDFNTPLTDLEEYM